MRSEYAKPHERESLPETGNLFSEVGTKGLRIEHQSCTDAVNDKVIPWPIAKYTTWYGSDFKSAIIVRTNAQKPAMGEHVVWVLRRNLNFQNLKSTCPRESSDGSGLSCERRSE